MWRFFAAVSLAFLCATRDANIQDSEVDITLVRYTAAVVVEFHGTEYCTLTGL